MEEGEIFEEEDILFLQQLIKSLEQGEVRLEDSYNKKDSENFNKSRKFILQIQKKISEVIK